LEQHLLPLSLLAVACATVAPAPAPSPTSPVEPASTASAPDATPPATATEPTAAAPPAEPAAPEAAPAELPKGTLVLHVGDSFAGALGVPLGKRLKDAGLRSVLEFQTSSYIPTWASGEELPRYVARYSPDLVIITLGANEFELQNPEQRKGAVRRLIKKLEGRPCVWVTPPRWKPDTGVLGVIRDNVEPCRFLDSDTIIKNLELKADHIHPNDAGREAWADAVLAWLVRERQGTAGRPWNLRME